MTLRAWNVLNAIAHFRRRFTLLFTSTLSLRITPIDIALSRPTPELPELKISMTTNFRPMNAAVRPASAPPHSAPETAGVRRSGEEDLRKRILSSSLLESADLPDSPTLDLMPQLQRSGPSIVKTRSGSVLSRGFILKTDHYPSGRPTRF